MGLNMSGIASLILKSRQRMFDMYHQKWYSDINNSNRLRSYCLFKHDFQLEDYFTGITDKKDKIALARFRTSSDNTGRYENTSRQERICRSCNMNQIEDEYHYFLVCPHFRELRTKYLKLHFCHWPTLNKFEALLSTTSKNVTILKPSSNRSPNIFTLVQKVKFGHTKRFNSKDKSRFCRGFAGYFISK